MPSFYFHERVALMALNAAGSPFAPAVALGSYGPDVFYCNSPLAGNAINRFGQRLHSERTCDFLVCLADAGARSELTRSYVRGYYTHYAVDTIFHPFVYAVSMAGHNYSAWRHSAVERTLDNWLYELNGGTRKRACTGLTDNMRDYISDAFSLATTECWPESDISLLDISQAMKRCINVTGVIGALSELPSSLRVESIDGKIQITPDQLQAFALLGWQHPWTHITSCDGPFELLGASLKRSGELLAMLDAYWDKSTTVRELRECIGDDSYLSGTYWRTAKKFVPIEMTRLRSVKGIFSRTGGRT